MNGTLEWITGILVALNSAQILYQAWKKFKPEIKKLEVEGDTEIVEAANLNLEGAKASAAILLDRINELKKELDEEKAARKEEFEREKSARAEDAEYFRRRIKELDREARDYRLWAAQLVKQVVEAGKIPVPFLPSINDSERLQAMQGDDKDKAKKE
jgi:polyhydroxyalkanoate synthesis regulator phasin